MKLTKDFIKDELQWKNAGIKLPEYDVGKMIENTLKRPTWVHFGAGNIFRGFIAMLQQKLLDTKQVDTGIVAVETYDHEIIDRIYKPYDNMGLLVLMKADGSLDKTLIGSLAEGLVGDTSRTSDWNRLKAIFSEPSLQMVSFTITEKGYSLVKADGEFLADVLTDIENGPSNPKHIISKITALAYHRYQTGKLPIAFVSMDNCSHNGEVLCNAITKMTQKWIEKGFVEKEFEQYMKDPNKVSFPWSMIDKITPRPSEKVQELLKATGFENTEIVCTDKKTFIAPFVNAEVTQYLVVEDHFPNGRMKLEDAGVLFADRQTVENVEKMKVTTCLNPLHTALAVFGCLLNYKLIADEMKDEQLKKLVEKIGYDEGMPAVIHPGILEPSDFIKDVLKERLPNPSIPDTPQRIACDTSQKMPIRFGETIKSYVRRSDLDITNLKFIPLVIAGWCRYMLGVDDEGNAMELSPDPMLAELQEYLKGIVLGDGESIGDKLKPILSSEKLFSIDLYTAGIGDKVEEYFKQMLAGKNAVRKVLEDNLI